MKIQSTVPQTPHIHTYTCTHKTNTKIFYTLKINTFYSHYNHPSMCLNTSESENKSLVVIHYDPVGTEMFTILRLGFKQKFKFGLFLFTLSLLFSLFYPTILKCN